MRSLTRLIALSRISCEGAAIWRYRGSSLGEDFERSGSQTPFVVIEAPVSVESYVREIRISDDAFSGKIQPHSRRTSCCVEPLVIRYRFLRSLISMLCVKAPSYRSFFSSLTAVAGDPAPCIEAILAATAAVVYNALRV